MNAKTKKQLRKAMDRGAEKAKAVGRGVVAAAEVVADEAQHAVKRYQRKRAIKKAGQVLLEIGKPAVAAAAAAAATVAAERLARRGERAPEPQPPQGETTPA
ncbi:MAG TPA: hypothetical protein VMH88_12885 [Gemmatimonadales bacterium]|nr:hypothetical protein [Gemmatimonadales bacterium]